MKSLIDRLEEFKTVTPLKMDCSKCHHKCKAECCSDIVPIPESTYEKFKSKIVNQPISFQHVEGHLGDGNNVIALTANAKCMFLNEDYSCNIYEDRPLLCKKFGDESHVYLTCSWQSKEGRIRSRQEKRYIERCNAKEIVNFGNKVIRELR